MSFFSKIEEKLKNIFLDCGYEVERVNFVTSSRSDLGDYQINDCMALAKKYGKNPRLIAEEIKTRLESEEYFCNINIAGPGFINITFTEKFYLDLLIGMNNDVFENIELLPKKNIFIDFGGANAAKALHVGHMRSANIGEALRRLAKVLGNNVISDVHLGDMGRQAGMVISELREEQPNLPWFDSNFTGEYPSVNLTNDDLGRLYPTASIKAKEDDSRMEEVRNITALIDKGDKVLSDLWKKIVDISSDSIKKTYDRLNCHFDLWEGEMDACNYKEQVLDVFKDHLYESEGALVVDVKEDTDKKEMLPLIVIKADGATIYATRDLGSIYSRLNRFDIDEMWYVTDDRQSYYFEQLFRASYKTGLVSRDVSLKHFGFGTINGKDGKPFKTRDGGVMELESLLDMVKHAVRLRVKEDIPDSEAEEISEMLTIATIKYADLLPFRGTDYIFDVEKFSELEGKTGPYLLYSTIRMKSLLVKAGDTEINFSKLNGGTDMEVAKCLFSLPQALLKAYNDKSLNEICEYLYRLTSCYNKFYAENRILTEEDTCLKASWLGLTKVCLEVNTLLLDILAIKVPEKM